MSEAEEAARLLAKLNGHVHDDDLVPDLMRLAWAEEEASALAPVARRARADGGLILKGTPATDSDHGGRVLLARLRMNVRGLNQIAVELDAAGPPQWVVEGLIPAGDYGVFGAERKAGKTWAATDLALSVASGGRWLDRWDCPQPGPVIVFAGEGGARKLIRRYRAVARHKDLDLDGLPIWLSERVPKLGELPEVDAFREEVAERVPRLVIVDPAYLAVAGAKAGILADMGALLERLQHACQDHGAALVVVHHWNKTGIGAGIDRFTGSGWTEWGRFLISASTEHSHVDPSGRSTAVIALNVVGDEMPERPHRFRREVWSDDPSDLASALHYELSEVDEPPLSARRQGALEDDELDELILEFVADQPGASKRMVRRGVKADNLSIDARIDALLLAGQIRVEKATKRGVADLFWPV